MKDMIAKNGLFVGGFSEGEAALSSAMGVFTSREGLFDDATFISLVDYLKNPDVLDNYSPEDFAVVAHSMGAYALDTFNSSPALSHQIISVNGVEPIGIAQAVKGFYKIITTSTLGGREEGVVKQSMPDAALEIFSAMPTNIRAIGKMMNGFSTMEQMKIHTRDSVAANSDYPGDLYLYSGCDEYGFAPTSEQMNETLQHGPSVVLARGSDHNNLLTRPAFVHGLIIDHLNG